MRKAPSYLGLMTHILPIWYYGLFKTQWAENAKRKACVRLSATLDSNIYIASLHFRWSGSLVLKGLEIKTKRAEISIKILLLTICYRSVLRGKLRLSSCSIDFIQCKFRNSVSNSNPGKGSSKNSLSGIPPGIFKLIFKLLFHSFKHTPSRLYIAEAEISVSIWNRNICVYLRDLKMQEKQYTFKLSTQRDHLAVSLFKGKFDKANRIITLDEYAVSDQKGATPPPESDFKFSSKVISIKLQVYTFSCFSLQLILKDVFIHWGLLSDQDINISNIELQIDGHLAASGFEIDETSTFRYNNILISLYACQDFPPENTCKLIFYMESIPINQFVQSFPSFKYGELYEAEFNGSIPGIGITFAFSLDNLFTHILEVEVENDASITVSNSSRLDLKIPFKHDIYDNGQYLKSIILSEINDEFISLDNFPQLLTEIIINTEDPQFYSHQGIDTLRMGQVIIQNVMEKKFIRGASTITMQLVRNLFLGHHKNIYRKMEEIMFSLLLENVYQIPKKRILELYLNIIEFGPGVYGISEAAGYYFSKPASALTIQECIVLSYIIPRPKYFLEAFEAGSEQLKRNLHSHIKFHSDKLAEKKLISQEDVAAVSTTIQIRNHILSLI